MNFDNKTVSEIEEILTYGQCYPTALALSEILGWPVGGLIVHASRSSWYPHLVHSYVLAPDGRAFDASGFRTTDDIYEEFLGNRPGKDFRDPRFVAYADPDEFRHALRELYERREMGADERSEYDDFLDESVPDVRQALTDRLDIEARVRAEFPCVDDVRGRFAEMPSDHAPQAMG